MALARGAARAPAPLAAPRSGAFYQLGPAFQARPGRWIGAKTGVFCLSLDADILTGHADFASFNFGPCERFGASGEKSSRVPLFRRHAAII